MTATYSISKVVYVAMNESNKNVQRWILIMTSNDDIKDNLLKRETLSFWIDEIYPVTLSREFGEEVFGVRVIPDMESAYFPPFHLRNIRVRPELLQQAFYESVIRNNGLDRGTSHLKFAGSVIQGEYYSIPTKELPHNVFKEKKILNSNTDVFLERHKENPCKDDVRGDKIINFESNNVYTICSTNQIKVEQGGVYIYCFNVGQGDSFLIITPNSNAYVVDLNLYGAYELTVFISKVKKILDMHKMPNNRLTALIITHKHLDHIRGADKFLLSEKFSVNYFMINLNYYHNTKVVERLLNAAKKVPTWVNINRKGIILDGQVHFCIKNPDVATSTNAGAPDINDSSICLCIRYCNNLAYMTGDASYTIINNQYKCDRLSDGENFLKVSHHGSRTGTDRSTVRLLNPTHAFISCGESANFQHPHDETKNVLLPFIDLKVSKKIEKTVRYTMDGKRISSTIMPY